MSVMSGWFAIHLWKRVLGALALGVAFAIVWPGATPAVAFMGDLFVRAIRMLVVPIVLVTIAAGITTLADPRRLGGLGARAIGLFAATTAIAVSVSMAGATVIRPCLGAPLSTAAPHQLGEPVTPYEQFIEIIPGQHRDMTRTVPGASANLAVTTAVARLDGELDEEVLRAPPEA